MELLKKTRKKIIKKIVMLFLLEIIVRILFHLIGYDGQLYYSKIRVDYLMNVDYFIITSLTISIVMLLFSRLLKKEKCLVIGMFLLTVSFLVLIISGFFIDSSFINYGWNEGNYLVPFISPEIFAIPGFLILIPHGVYVSIEVIAIFLIRLQISILFILWMFSFYAKIFIRGNQSKLR